MSYQVSTKRPTCGERAGQIRLQDGVVVRVCERLGGEAPLETGGVDEDVDAAGSEEGGKGLGYRGTVGNVAGADGAFSAEGKDLILGGCGGHVALGGCVSSEEDDRYLIIAIYSKTKRRLMGVSYLK